MRISEAMVYLTDNGAALCGKHLGSSAKHTGRDISGQEILPITPEIAAEAVSDFGYIPTCEHCGHKASLIVEWASGYCGGGSADAEEIARNA